MDDVQFPDEITIGQKYGPAMSITDSAEAHRYFEACVEHTMRFGPSREEAEAIEKANLGYYAGYGDRETRQRVERLFSCAHPIFGPASEVRPPTTKEAFALGKMRGEAER